MLKVIHFEKSIDFRWEKIIPGSRERNFSGILLYERIGVRDRLNERRNSVSGMKMQCNSSSSSNSSGGGIVDRKPSYFSHPGGSVTLSSLSSLGSLNLSNIGGLSISNIPGTVSTNIHHATTPPPTTMYYDQIKYSMWRKQKRRIFFLEKRTYCPREIVRYWKFHAFKRRKCWSASRTSLQWSEILIKLIIVSV